LFLLQQQPGHPKGKCNKLLVDVSNHANPHPATAAAAAEKELPVIPAAGGKQKAFHTRS
jgi:hypothetical protein